jgi:CRP-like cAMP-binding protein
MDGIELLVRRLAARDVVTAQEEAALRAAAALEERYPAGVDVIRQGVTQTLSRLLVEGVVARVKLVADGGRQITEIHIPGDFVDLHSFLLKKLDHDVVALTRVRFVSFPHEALKRITEEEPHLTRLLWLGTLIDAAGHRQWLVGAGRKSAVEQIAGIFCELYARYQIVGLAQGASFPMPMTQRDLADACGLSTVHANRVVQEIRELGLIAWTGKILTILDYDALAALAQFDPAFLILNREPR